MNNPQKTRPQLALKLRNQGFTYAEIGKRVGRRADPSIPITPWRAQYLVMTALRRQAMIPKINELMKLPILKQPIDIAFDLTIRQCNALLSYPFRTYDGSEIQIEIVEDLLKFSPNDLLQRIGLGEKSVKHIKNRLAILSKKYGIELKLMPNKPGVILHKTFGYR